MLSFGVKTSEIISSDTSRKMVPLCKGIKAAIKNPANISHKSIEQTEKILKANDDIYEILWVNNTEDHCRAFVDLDGSMDDDTFEEDFEAQDLAIKHTLSELDIGTPFALMTASKYRNKDWKDGKIKHKLSYRLTFKDRCGTADAVQHWINAEVYPKISDALRDTIEVIGMRKTAGSEDKPNTLNIDQGVYENKRKMRCWNSSKSDPTTGYNEQRRNVLVNEDRDTVADTLITYVPEDCTVLPPPPKEVSTPKAVVTPPTPKKNNEVIVADATDASLSAEKQLIVRVLEGISADVKYQPWLQIGMACFNEEIPLKYWDEWSQKSNKYVRGECKQKWVTFRKGNVTQAYLWKILKDTNPTVFRELIGERKDFQRLINNPSHYTVAEYFYNCRPNDYLYDSAAGWYGVTSTNVWENPKNKGHPATMKNRIVRLFNAERFEIEAEILRKKRDADAREDNEEIKRLDELNKKILAFREKYENDGFQRGLISFLSSFYAEQSILLMNARGVKVSDGITGIFDTNPNLFAFNDELYDFQLKAFRPIQQTDYITITTGYARPTRNPEVRSKIMEVLTGMWEDDAPRDYMLTLLASCLNGTRNMEVFSILTGRGGNGKGILWKLVQNVFGGYYYELPTQVLTKSVESATAATPQIAELRGMRCVCAKEPEYDDRLQEGTIKSLTGGDLLAGRALYGSPVVFQPQFGLFIQCNVIPTFNGFTKGGMRRNRVIPFPFNFIAIPKLSYDRKGDPYIKNVLCSSISWRDEFFYILLDYYPRAEGKQIDAIPTPPLVAERTNGYVAENNAIGEWWFEKYEVCENEYVGSRDAFEAYKADSGKRIGDKEFKNGLAFNDIDIVQYTRAGPMKGRKVIMNWRRKEQREEIL